VLPLDCCDRGFEIQLTAWNFVYFVRYVVSGLYNELTTRLEDFYLLCMCVSDLETLTMMRPRHYMGCCATNTNEIMCLTCLFKEIIVQPHFKMATERLLFI
jgi:hypothetical protein